MGARPYQNIKILCRGLLVKRAFYPLLPYSFEAVSNEEKSISMKNIRAKGFHVIHSKLRSSWGRKHAALQQDADETINLHSLKSSKDINMEA